MNKNNLIILRTVFLFTIFLSACGSSSVQNDAISSNEDEVAEEEMINEDDSNKDHVNEGSNNAGLDESTNVDSPEGQESDALSEYSAEEIEYARVWLQVTGNKDTEELNVEHISAGEPINPYDDQSANYPEDVISLGGKIMADGAVIYSGNGDGTINLYNIPSHWPSYQQIDKSMEEYTKDIINNTKQIYIEPRADEEISRLIEKIDYKTHSVPEDTALKTDTSEEDQEKAISLVRDYMRNTYADFIEDEDHFLAYDGEVKGWVIVRYATLFSGHTSTNGRYAVNINSGEIQDFFGDPQDMDL
ncbi:hypothetical protein FZC78_10165 [Rossellomorea vietnamensis]|uniref:Uncharacterized protein n=1 Tax=Rossellomorea vietnamensis TaxID=218284 RepID=A0A5D4NUH9_9BACI|nr:hypothetical protein [Rossellomorea vietnamensis]TYS16986.1 hypothetical protein FZC78_10165 [Rossellomorea vietnamensis]